MAGQIRGVRARVRLLRGEGAGEGHDDEDEGGDAERRPKAVFHTDLLGFLMA
jgi:hypothetical protein